MHDSETLEIKSQAKIICEKVSLKLEFKTKNSIKKKKSWAKKVEDIFADHLLEYLRQSFW